MKAFVARVFKLAAFVAALNPGERFHASADDATRLHSTEQRKQHWAFQPVARPAIPAVKNQRWPRNSVDQFILARLEQEQLPPSHEADRLTLIRRASFDVIGLPPTPAEIDDFLADKNPDAYERLVERLLASPRYGERWARHWLDVVRFAESAGFETNLARDDAWPYRDYVIRSFNDDKPYPQFIREQLAGDACGEDAATGYLVGGPSDAVKSPDIVLTRQQRMDELHDMVATTGSAFLGLTVGCARCHDHKFDPIPQADYYAMQAIFAGVQHGSRVQRPADWDQRQQQAEAVRQSLAELERELKRFEAFEALAQIPGPATNAALNLRAPVHPRKNVERFAPVTAKFLRFTVLATTSLEPCIDELEIFSASDSPRNVALASAGTKATASGTYPNSEIHRLEHINDGRHGNSRSWISDEAGRGWVQLEFPTNTVIDRVVWGRDREEKFSDRLATNYLIEVALATNAWRAIASSADRQPFVAGAKAEPDFATNAMPADAAAECSRLLARRKGMETKLKHLTAMPKIYAGKFSQPEATHRLHRGDPMQEREVVTPGALSELGAKLELAGDMPEQQRRLALANWISDPANPLTARVMVNRLWHYHFGRGLVNTPSDFGHNGARPSHPELLDWLASEFVAHGWSLKAMHRLILLSATYRQASAPGAKGLGADAGTRLLWRFPPRRLEAEAIRDAMLAVSGKLDLKMGGPGFDLFEPNNNYVKVYNSKQEFGPAEWRRMVYQSKPRMQLDDTFGAFDCPDAGQIAPKRNRSVTALQALNLLNSRFVMQQAGFLAERLEHEAGQNRVAQIRLAFRLAFGRAPTSSESAAAEKLIAQEGLPIFCRALFNANEFVFTF